MDLDSLCLKECPKAGCGGQVFQEHTVPCRMLSKVEHIFVGNSFLKQQITKASFREIVKCKLPLSIFASFVYHWTRAVSHSSVAHDID